MAKHTTTQCRKFKAALRKLGIPGPHLLGHLEYIWQSAHIEGDPVFTDSDEVEAAAEWSGEPGTLATALIDTGWLDSRKDGKIEVHDYWEHAPKYVQERDRIRVKRRANKFQQIPTNSNTCQQTPTSCRLLDTTDTDTDTDTDTRRSIADTDRSSLSRARGGQPEALGALSASAIDGMVSGQYAEWWRRVAALVEPYALDRWQDTMTRYVNAGGSSAELEELVCRFEDASNQAIRDAKGIGEFTDAPRAMMKHMTRLCKRIGVRWQTYPSGVTV